MEKLLRRSTRLAVSSLLNCERRASRVGLSSLESVPFDAEEEDCNEKKEDVSGQVFGGRGRVVVSSDVDAVP